MAGDRRPGIQTPAVAVLQRAGVAYRLHRYEHDPAAASFTSFGREAAAALGLDPGRVFKTLVTSVDGELVVVIVPVTGEIDLKALAGAQKAKRAEMADPAAAEKATGYVIGGISPLGQRRRLATVVDDRATAWDTIFVSGGRRGLELELSPHDLIALTAARLAPVLATTATG